jgi:hypothetical protein
MNQSYGLAGLVQGIGAIKDVLSVSSSSGPAGGVQNANISGQKFKTQKKPYAKKQTVA